MTSSIVGAVLGRRLDASVRVLVAVSKLQLQQAIRSRLCRRLPWLMAGRRNVLPQSSSVVPTFALSSARSSDNLLLFSEQSGDQDDRHRGSSGGGERRSSSIMLMDYRKLRWPNPINVFRNYIFTALIRISFDQEFTMSSFLAGAEQAVSSVSDLISRGRFDELEGLVTDDAVQEVSHNYRNLNDTQRKFIAVNTNDIFLRFIYEIGMIFDDDTQRRFVEITTVFQGLHGLSRAKTKYEHQYLHHLNREATYVCNYRFIREYTKGKEDSWTINKLNHFHTADVD